MAGQEDESSAAEAIDTNYSDTEELAREVHKVNESMSLLKRRLLEQQLFVKKLIDETKVEPGTKKEAAGAAAEPSKNITTTTENTTPTNSLLTLDDGSQYDPTRPQVCPMCEATFPAVDVTHEVFVDHVNSHFTCEEEPDTLHNYEVVENVEASMLPAS